MARGDGHEENVFHLWRQDAPGQPGGGGVALAVIVAVWLVGGIGLAGCGIEVFSTPLWIIGGTIGPWIAAIVCAVVLARCVFADFSLDDDAEAAAVAATAGATDAEGEEARRG